MIKIVSSGNTKNTDSFLATILSGNSVPNVEAEAQRGVDALKQATPKSSGLTADGWSYEIEREGDSVTIYWINTHEINGFNVAVGLQYGHGTGSGGWIAGYDYINPALKSIFDKIADDVWKEVQKA